MGVARNSSWSHAGKKNGAVACTILKLKYEHSLLKRH